MTEPTMRDDGWDIARTVVIALFALALLGSIGFLWVMAIVGIIVAAFLVACWVAL